MKIVILGGTGTIGLPITRRLAERGDEVIVFTRGRRSEAIPAGVQHVIGDRSDTAHFSATMKEIGAVDCVIDMICYRTEDAQVDIDVFAGLTRQLIFCSTVDVHRKDCLTDYLQLPADETTELKPLPSFAYAVNKLACEELFNAAHDRGDLAVTTIRPALTYREGGSPLHPFMGGSYHLDRLIKGKPIIIHGDGTSLWTACHSEDVSTAFVNAVGNEATLGKGYTVAGDQWMSWDYCWRAVARTLGAAEPKLVHIPTDVLQRVAPTLSSWIPFHFQFHAVFDTAASKRDLGFTYTISWEEGAGRCVEWLREHGGFQSSDDYGAYDCLIEAWNESIDRMSATLVAVSGL